MDHFSSPSIVGRREHASQWSGKELAVVGGIKAPSRTWSTTVRVLR